MSSASKLGMFDTANEQSSRKGQGQVIKFFVQEYKKGKKMVKSFTLGRGKGGQGGEGGGQRECKQVMDTKSTTDIHNCLSFLSTSLKIILIYYSIKYFDRDFPLREHFQSVKFTLMAFLTQQHLPFISVQNRYTCISKISQLSLLI